MIRIGHGYDVHRLICGRDLYLCGVKIPHDKGLLGHSDADVAIHALCDSLLGAAALGDIGRHFPDNDEKYKGIDSKVLLKEVCKMLKDNGYKIGNADITIVAQEPKLSPYIEQMRCCISQCTGTDLGQISVKATTEENLGVSAGGGAIAAHSVCLIEK